MPNNSLLKLSEIYKTKDEVHDVFAVILFNEQHPFVSKVLRDEDFWTSLDSASGKRWPIFAIRPKAGMERQKIVGNASGGQNLLTVIPWWDEPKENVQLLREFGLHSTKDLPMLLVFAQLSGGDLLQMQCPFAAKSEEDTYNTLKDIIDKAAGAIEKVTMDNIKNTQEIFNLIHAELGQYVLIQRAKSVVAVGKWVTSIFGLFH